jgi:hypothetical protein
MSTEKALKYNILGQLSNFGLKKSVENLIDTEEVLDHVIQPDPQVIEDLAESPGKI